MDKKDENSPANLWTRRSNSSKLSLNVKQNDRNDTRDSDSSSARRLGSASATSRSNPFSALGSAPSLASPTTGAGASSAFGLGSGAFASFGSTGKTPKTPGTAFDFSKGTLERRESTTKEEKEEKRPVPRKSLSALRANSEAQNPSTPSKDNSSWWSLKHAWVIHYRPPTSKNSDYEKSMRPLCRIDSAQAFWSVYSHLKRPSALPTVSDYHFFKEGIRPVWEDEENKRGGKWIMRVKKGVADRYWEELLLAMIGDQFAEASDEVCGAVVSVRSGEDVFSIWTKNDGGRNVKIRETIKRVLSLPPDTNLQWRSHDESITQRNAVDQARQEKAASYGDKRRNTLTAEKDKTSKDDSA
ncbi:translation initiation factor eIF 4e-like domain-containing protein [Neohortaea acidophila]|uniref:Translation initiation factor eIF 4e-like domain-containing protein n=1 Tax=Neohortaea acidophila TaxID=245834 RepID=A0A6A6PUK0_9PEZI|nr:translation initiation factor eIF 4e-like domain-containing protein [Neohortaea acidophila]KAF2483672.1 translation initiation factor eIF 4e-like domain-containing protein [Neohortaea acidophila]